MVEATSATLQPGAFVCVIGRNGAGKSTLMRTICGLQQALAGSASLRGRTIAAMGQAERARSIAVVTTDRVSSPGLLAHDVVALGRHPYTNWTGRLTEKDEAIIANALRTAGAEPFGATHFDGLSDGERQRVMIARALAQSSPVMVLDEITAFLDLPGRVEIMALLRRQARHQGKIVLLSSHDLELSLELAGELWIVHAGRLIRGAPNALIDQGVIAEAFDSQDVAFDKQRGRFALRDA
ncbi:MAG: ABC transporter ATP-binding protein [Caulobacterales bacterium]|nr:ABC transporter ATP-binding protein [Caulobacterales bacterium]